MIAPGFEALVETLNAILPQLDRPGLEPEERGTPSTG